MQNPTESGPGGHGGREKESLADLLEVCASSSEPLEQSNPLTNFLVPVLDQLLNKAPLARGHTARGRSKGTTRP
jgi:hypothetical protein